MVKNMHVNQCNSKRNLKNVLLISFQYFKLPPILPPSTSLPSRNNLEIFSSLSTYMMLLLLVSTINQSKGRVDTTSIRKLNDRKYFVAIFLVLIISSDFSSKQVVLMLIIISMRQTPMMTILSSFTDSYGKAISQGKNKEIKNIQIIILKSQQFLNLDFRGTTSTGQTNINQFYNLSNLVILSLNSFLSFICCLCYSFVESCLIIFTYFFINLLSYVTKLFNFQLSESVFKLFF